MNRSAWLMLVLGLVVVSTSLAAQKQDAAKAKEDVAVAWTKTVIPGHAGTTQDKYELQVGDSYCAVRSSNARDSIYLEVLPIGHTSLGDPSKPDQIFMEAIFLHQVHILDGKVMPKVSVPVSRRFDNVCGKATKNLPAAVQNKMSPYMHGGGHRA